MTKLKLTKIEIETGNHKKIELTIDEAKELHDQLHELFGKTYIPSQPIIIDRSRPYWERPYISWEDVTCTGGAITSNGDRVKMNYYCSAATT